MTISAADRNNRVAPRPRPESDPAVRPAAQEGSGTQGATAVANHPASRDGSENDSFLRVSSSESSVQQHRCATAGDATDQAVSLRERRRANRSQGSNSPLIGGPESAPQGVLQDKIVTGTVTPNADVRDNQTLNSSIHLTDDVKLENLNLGLDITHSYKGDLKVELTSPAGTTAVVHDRSGGSEDNIQSNFDLSRAFAGESTAGEWTLSVTDNASQDEGKLNSWSLEATGKAPEAPKTPEAINKRVTANTAIEDNKTIESKVQVDEKAEVGKVELDLDLAHTYRGDLVVSLTSPSGKTAVISNKEGGSADDLKGQFDLSSQFKGESAEGEWTLAVQDTASQDTGTLKEWGLKITPAGAVEPPPPTEPSDDSDPMKHIEVLASDEMAGRDSPSEGLTAAGRYVQDFAEKYGLEGINSANPDNPFVQEFDLWRFQGLQSEHDLLHNHEDHAHGHDHDHGDHQHPGHSDPTKWGGTTFDSGFFMDENISQESLEILNKRYEELAQLNGVEPVPSLTGGPRSVEELRALAAPDVKTQNVMAKLEGTGPNKDEVILVMAHLDHVGVGRNGVNNGADDNASGSAVLMAAIPELVEAQKNGELDRSIVFLWTGAEEKGLVGSQYFADHPIPGATLDDIVGVVNIDMIGRWDDQRISIVDSDSRGRDNYFSPMVRTANEQMDDPFDRINEDIDAYRDRQDGAVFSRRGEDVLFVFEGLSNPNGGGRIMADYHGPGDDVEKIYQENGGNKPRRVKDFTVNVLKQAVNREADQA